MSKRKPPSASIPKKRRTAGEGVSRMDGVAHWRKTLDRLIWMLLRAGIDPDEIVDRTVRVVKARRRTAALAMPSPEVLEYARVLTFWRNEPQFLDAAGRPLVLAAIGKSPTFKSLVQMALPRADAQHVLTVLRHHRLVSEGRHGRITLLGRALLPRTAQRAQFVAYALAAIEGLVDTCHTNLNARDPAQSVGLLQRIAVAERFDPRYLRQYDSFMRAQAEAFLLKQDEWLQRREVNAPTKRKTRAVHVGVGVYGFRARSDR